MAHAKQSAGSVQSAMDGEKPETKKGFEVGQLGVFVSLKEKKYYSEMIVAQ